MKEYKSEIVEETDGDNNLSVRVNLHAKDNWIYKNHIHLKSFTKVRCIFETHVYSLIMER